MSVLLIFSVILMASSLWVLYLGVVEDYVSLIPVGILWAVLSSILIVVTANKIEESVEKAAICNPAVQICEEKK